jgi:hypothetical protein
LEQLDGIACGWDAQVFLGIVEFVIGAMSRSCLLGAALVDGKSRKIRVFISFF